MTARKGGGVPFPGQTQGLGEGTPEGKSPIKDNPPQRLPFLFHKNGPLLGTLLVQSVQPMTFNLSVMSSSPILGVEIS